MHRCRVPAAITPILAIVALALPIVSAAASPPLILASGGDASTAPPPRVEVVSSSAQGVTFEFSLPALTVDRVTAPDGNAYDIVAIPGGGSTGEIGSPEIPVFTRLVSIPPASGVRVESTVLEQEEHAGFRLSPMQSDEIDRIDAHDFAFDAAAYARDDFGPTASAARCSGGPAILRDLRTVPLTIDPIRYNPARGVLQVARRVRIDVHFEGTDLENALPAVAPRPIAPSFDRIYRGIVLNYPPDGGDLGGSHVGVAPGTWVAICTSNDVATRIQPLADWHKRKGIPVRVALTNETGTTKEAIKAWLTNAYSTWPIPPEYVTLCGDADGTYGIGTWYEDLSGYGGAGDHPYSQLSGGDVLADVHVGRLSFQNLTDLETIVAKCVGYESAPATGGDPGWFQRACLVGDPSSSGISTVQLMQWAKTRLRQLNYTQIDTVFGGDFAGQMATDLNRGDTIFAYRGWLGMSGFGTSNINALSNGWKLPFCVIPTCDTGTFYSGTSRSEAFLRAGNSTTPKGGIGAIGTATIGTHTRFNNCITYGILYGVLYEGDYAIGAALTRGKYELYLNYQARDPNHVLVWSYWNSLMGDPAVECWTGYPAAITVTAPATVPVGTNAITVQVQEDGGAPCAGADVCLWKGSETYVLGATDGTGRIELPVSLQLAGSILLTVTKHNRMPYLASIGVVNSAVFVSYQSSTIDDDSIGDSHGNGDGIVNPNETIECRVQLHNYGSQTAPAVTASITSVDPYITITQGTASYGDIGPGGTASGVENYVFAISPACPHGRAIRLGLDVTSGTDQWHSIFEIPVVSADLVATGTTILNAGPNGLFDPGETVQMTMKLRNLGGIPATGIGGILTSMTPLVTVLDAYATWSDLAPNQSAENLADPFTVTASPRVYAGTLATFQLVTSFSGGLTDTSYVTVPIGQRAVTDPTGPDSYGYLAFDNGDIGYADAPVYSWVELDPTYGGNGTQLALNDFGQYQDASIVIDLPFPFGYYGQSYTRATVCSNGWIAMGSTYLREYRNWTIPGAGGPQSMIAAFWDDLSLGGGGKVLSRYDATGHRFIVEWSHVTNDPGSTQTFEIIFLDPAYFPTMTGDGQIIFQYNTVNNTDANDNYATVGIENADHSDGLLYSFYAAYTGGSASLVSGRAIRFTTTIPGAADAGDATASHPAFALRQNAPNPWKESTAIAFSLDRAGAALLQVFDVQGRVVRKLVDGVLPAGARVVAWDGRDDRGTLAPAGIFFYRLQAGNRSEVRKLIRIE